jgi:hypothetical protein
MIIVSWTGGPVTPGHGPGHAGSHAVFAEVPLVAVMASESSRVSGGSPVVAPPASPELASDSEPSRCRDHHGDRQWH